MGVLRQLTGIGSRTEEMLVEAGIATIEDLARADPAQIAHVSGYLSFISQARARLGEVERHHRTIEVLDRDTGEKQGERYEVEVEVRSPTRHEINYHPLSPWFGQEVDGAVLEAVNALAQVDIDAGHAPIKTEHVITWLDAGHQVVLTCEPGGKRVWRRG